MTEQEGVIKFELCHRPAAAAYVDVVRRLDPWRTLLHRLDLIGQDPGRYGGLGFGNVSHRLDGALFIVSGTQTGGKTRLTPDDYAVVRHADPARNRIESTGPIEPSSEALTHAAVYRAAPEVGCVIHVHCPEIWHGTRALALPSTAGGIAYGTPQMAYAVERLFHSGALSRIHLFTMLGHEDGVVAFGPTPEAASIELIRQLARALETQ